MHKNHQRCGRGQVAVTLEFLDLHLERGTGVEPWTMKKSMTGVGGFNMFQARMGLLGIIVVIIARIMVIDG